MKNCILIFALVFLSSCSGIRLTLKNESNQDFESLVVKIGNETYNFKNLKKGEKTKSIKVNGTYYYFPTKIITKNDTIYANAFCYVGEKYYKSGKLLVSLTIENSESENFIEFKPNR